MKEKKTIKQKYESALKKRKTKTILKWIAVGLGWTSLFALFVALLCLGIKGCSNKSAATKAESINDSIPPVTTPVKRTYGVEPQQREYYYITDNINFTDDIIPYGNVSGEVRTTGSYFILNGNSYYFDNFTYEINTNSSIGFYRVAFYNDEEQSLVTEFVHYANGTNNGWTPYIQGFIFDEDLSNNYYLRPFFRCLSPYNGSTIHFNDIINPYGPLGGSFDYFITGTYEGYYKLFEGIFKTTQDNELYKNIQIFYTPVSATRFGTTDNYQIAQSGIYSEYDFIVYTRLSDNKQVVVNMHDYGIATSGSQAGNGVYLKSNHWISSIFQDIQIIAVYEDASDYVNSNLTALQRLSTLNNLSGSSGIDFNNGNTGVFGLIGSAFGAIVSLFSVQVLPSITLGVFIFIPLVVCLIIFVVKLFKR